MTAIVTAEQLVGGLAARIENGVDANYEGDNKRLKDAMVAQNFFTGGSGGGGGGVAGVSSFNGRTGSVTLGGSDIKTINGQSMVGSGNIDISAGVSSFNGRTGAVTLGSSDIKTVNGQSLLGTGNIDVSGGVAGVSSFNGRTGSVTLGSSDIKTINGQSMVGSGNIDISGGGLPDQAGNSGRFLRTNGTNPEWADLPTSEPTTYQWGINDAPILVVLGQSNAYGHGTVLPVSEQITTPLANVKTLDKTIVYTQDPGAYWASQNLWKGLTSTGSINLGVPNGSDLGGMDNTANVAVLLANKWQHHINSGNAMRLPDLHIIMVAYGSQGINKWTTDIGPDGKPNNRWAPERDPSEVDSLFHRTINTLRAAIRNLQANGKNPRLIGVHWNQWEAEAITTDNAQRSSMNFSRIVSGISSALGSQRVPWTFYYPINDTLPGTPLLRKTVESLASSDPLYNILDAHHAPGYVDDPAVNYGVLHDQYHYSTSTNIWFADQVWAGISAGTHNGVRIPANTGDMINSGQASVRALTLGDLGVDGVSVTGKMRIDPTGTGSFPRFYDSGYGLLIGKTDTRGAHVAWSDTDNKPFLGIAVSGKGNTGWASFTTVNFSAPSGGSPYTSFDHIIMNADGTIRMPSVTTAATTTLVPNLYIDGAGRLIKSSWTGGTGGETDKISAGTLYTQVLSTGNVKTAGTAVNGRLRIDPTGTGSFPEFYDSGFGLLIGKTDTRGGHIALADTQNRPFLGVSVNGSGSSANATLSTVNFSAPSGGSPYTSFDHIIMNADGTIRMPSVVNAANTTQSPNVYIDSTGRIIRSTWTGVTSFNSRSGAVTLGSGDVTGALGYTPLSTNGGAINPSNLSGRALTVGASSSPYGQWNVFLKSQTGQPAVAIDATGAESTGITVFKNNQWGDFMSCWWGNTTSFSLIGRIAPNTAGTQVQFLTTSDYRLKTDVAEIDSPSELVKRLKPCKFKWRADPAATEVYGFLAHEVAEVLDGVVSGEKDATDAAGNLLPQSVDLSKLVPVLTAALKDAISRIEDLERKLIQTGN